MRFLRQIGLVSLLSLLNIPHPFRKDCFSLEKIKSHATNVYMFTYSIKYTIACIIDHKGKTKGSKEFLELSVLIMKHFFRVKSFFQTFLRRCKNIYLLNREGTDVSLSSDPFMR